MFSYFSRTPTCDRHRQTARQTQTQAHGHSIYRESIARAVKRVTFFETQCILALLLCIFTVFSKCFANSALLVVCIGLQFMCNMWPFHQESMKLMGMKGWIHWSSWYFKFSIFMLLTVAIVTVLFHIKFPQHAVITYSDPSITFMFLLLFSLSVMTFCFFISTFFSKGMLLHCVKVWMEWDGYKSQVQCLLVPYSVKPVDIEDK